MLSVFRHIDFYLVHTSCIRGVCDTHLTEFQLNKYDQHSKKYVEPNCIPWTVTEHHVTNCSSKKNPTV